MPTLVSGVRSSSNANSNNQLRDVERILQVLKPYQTPFLQLLWFGGRPAKPVVNATGKFEWFEDTLFPHQTTVKLAITASGSPATLSLTATNCTDITVFGVGDVVLIEETDQMAVVTSHNGTTVVLTHIDGSTSLTSLAVVGSVFKVIGNQNNEYNGVRTGKSTTEVEQYNYLTIQTESVGTTGRNQAGSAYTNGLTHPEMVAKKIEEMKLTMERNMLFSNSRGYKTVDGYRHTWGNGFLGRVTSNVNGYSTLDQATFDAHFQEVFAKGSNRRIHMCGSNQLVAVNKIVKDLYQVVPNPSVSAFGVNITEYITPFGTVAIVFNPLMDGKFTNWGFTIDPELVTLRYMADDAKGSRKFRIEENVQTPGTDGKQDKLLMDVGLQLVSEECHGILKKTS